MSPQVGLEVENPGGANDMPLNLSDKKQVLAEVADIASRAHSAVAADYRGLTVGKMTELRDKAREADGIRHG